jgi:DNA-binding CsgD family transcriptional regulator/tetratricopeptide (TPR) repeat protein
MAVVPLVGRVRESAVIAGMLDSLPSRGGALVLRGEPGIGKSTLLVQARALAVDRGMLVLSITGVQAETNLPFAGLHRLLRPVLGFIDRLPVVQRDALMAAFGMVDATAPDPFVIALAALELLSDAASESPVALIVEDAQWLDPPTGDILAFVGRRVESDPIILLAAIRDGYEESPLASGLPELSLDRLSDGPARQILEAAFPDLGTAVRQRVLDEAAGNPLALRELPLALGSRDREGEEFPPRLALTTRLEQAFASRAAELPNATRTLLRVAAADDRDGLGEIMSAAEIVDGAAPTVEALVPAVDAKLIEVHGPTVRFRHPLIRSAIQQDATIAERHATHRALAEVLAHDPERRVWHRAAATVGSNEEVASELEKAAGQAQRRGANILAVAAFERAAALTAEAARRGALLLRAAALARELGRSDLLVQLLGEADRLELGSRDRARSMWLQDALQPVLAGDTTSVHALVKAAERMIVEGDTNLALDLLSAAAFRCFFGEPGAEARSEVLLALGRTGAAPTDHRTLLIQAYTAPIERGAVVIEGLPSSTPDEDADVLRALGTAAQAVGAFDRSSSLLATSVARLREQGRLGLLAQVLVSQAWAAITLGDWSVALPAAEEAARLARETGQPLWEAGAQATSAMVAAVRGERAELEVLAGMSERVALPAGATAILASVQFARGWLALGQGRHAQAHEQFRRMFEPGDPSYHHMMRCWAVGDLAEAAAHSDQQNHARAVLRELEPLARATPSPWLHVGMLYARPLLAPEKEAEPLFRAALATDMTRWPLYRARLQLAFGEWLRRQRRTAEARGPLRAARDAFDALGAELWGERTRQELRASGESSRRRTPDTLDELTPQELQIAQMAAAGLSNREIGQRLYLSHRTIESHLYRVFPKLGITSRAELSVALGSRASDPA